MRIKRIFSIILVLCLCVAMLPLPAQASTTVTSQAVADHFKRLEGQYYKNGMCLAFVARGFEALGGSFSSACCAYNYGSSHIASTDINSIPVGADVFFGNCGGGPCASCGSTYYGHVGVYVGNGEFVHATGGEVLKSPLSGWSHLFRGWGYHGGIVISDSVSPTPDPTPSANNPQGWLDLVEGGCNTVTVKGWAYDADDLNAALEIRIYVDHVLRGTLTANQERTDVNEDQGCGNNHGFEGTIRLDTAISGSLEVEVWATNIGSGSDSYLGTRTVTITSDDADPVITDAVISDLSSSGYTVTCTVTDNIGVDRVLFPTWTLENDQDDLPSVWGVGTASGNTYSYRVSTADHNNETGVYATHIYAYDAAGNSTMTAITVTVPNPDSTAPVISEVHVYNITTDGYTVVCKATDNIGVDRVQFPTWTTTNGQDDLTWGEGTKNGDYYAFRVNASEHNNETTGYVTHIYAYDADGNHTTYNLSTRALATAADTQAPVISDVQITDLSAVGYTVTCTVTDDQNVNRVQMPTWTSANGQDDILANWQLNAKARATADGTTYTYRVKISAHNHETGTYGTHIYAYDDAGNLATYKIEANLGDIVVPEHFPDAEGLKDDFYAVIENNASRTVLTSTDNVVFSANQDLDTQLWHFVKNADGTYMICGAADENLVLDIEYAKDSTDANVQMCANNGSQAQKWYIHEYGGLYYLRPACSTQLLLDLPYASTADGSAAKINYPNLGGGEGMNLVGDIFRTYTVTYDANGGENAPAAQTKIWSETLTLRNTAPSRAGFNFLGWAASADASAPAYMPGDSYSDDASVTLYAVWESNAPAVVTSGWSGDTEWTLTSDGVLTFSGEGAMRDYTYKSEMPWYSYFDQITSVVIESGVTAIGDYAFYGMGIESITIPETVTVIGDYAFKNCPVLDHVVLPSGLTKLGESSFYACTGLTAIEIPASLWTVQPYTFKNCTALASVKFYEGNLLKISDGAFYNTALTTVELPDCLDILDVYSFKNCSKLTSITIGSGLTEIREAAFYGTAIPTITIPEGITKIGPYAFKTCVKLETIDLPESLTSVGEASFYACTGLKSLELPDSVTTIGNYAFRKCAGIENLTFGSGLVTIGECSFYGCTGLTEIVIPDQVTTIKPYAFKTCTGLTSVTLGGSVATIGEGAFNTCTGLKTMIFPASVKTIGDYSFSGSTSIWKLTFAGDAPTIGTGAFKSISATAYYPGDNTTWTSDNMLNYGGTITWKAN